MDNTQKIREIVKAYNLKSQTELAKTLKISPQLLGYWGKNNIDIPKVKASLPDINTDWLITGEGPVRIDGSTTMNQPHHFSVNGDMIDQRNNAEREGDIADFAARVAFLEKQNEEKDAAIKKRDQQIDRLLTIIEHQNGINNQ